ncbi:hypothetical protein V1524DRAFT_438150 [Lipomyces starkeyi]
MARRHSLYVQRAAPIHFTRIFFSSAVGYNLYPLAFAAGSFSVLALFVGLPQHVSGTEVKEPTTDDNWPNRGNWFRPPFLGVAGGRGQPQLLTDLCRNAVPEW